MFFEPSTKDRALGINKVRERLAERDVFGLPTIYFSPRVTETLFEFTHYVFDPKTNKPIDMFDHQMENLYRAVLNGLGYIDPNWEAPAHKPFAIGVEQNLLSLNPSYD